MFSVNGYKIGQILNNVVITQDDWKLSWFFNKKGECIEFDWFPRINQAPYVRTFLIRKYPFVFDWFQDKHKTLSICSDYVRLVDVNTVPSYDDCYTYNWVSNLYLSLPKHIRDNPEIDRVFRTRTGRSMYSCNLGHNHN